MIERIKSFVLTILILSSITLTGSLWFDNYYGLSSVISSVFSIGDDTFDGNAEQLIMPIKATITNGDKGKWVYYPYSNGNIEGYNLIKNILNSFNSEIIKIDKASFSEWQDVYNRKSAIVEFGDSITLATLKISAPLNKNLQQDIISNIQAIAVTKTISGGLLYIKESDEKIVRVETNSSITEIEQYIDKYTEAMNYFKLITLDEMGTKVFYNNKKVEAGYNTFFPVSNKQNYRMRVNKLSKEVFNIEKAEKIVTKLFNNYDYSKFMTKEREYIYINDDSRLIKIDENGYFEYTNKKISTQSKETSLINSFNTSIKFIDMVLPIYNVYLIGVSEDKGQYCFKYGVAYNGVPLVDTSKPENEMKVIMSVVVENDNIISAVGNMSSYNISTTNSYVTYFAHNILDKLFDKASQITKGEVIEINSVEFVFDINNLSEILPSWIATYRIKDTSSFVLIDAAKERNY